MSTKQPKPEIVESDNQIAEEQTGSKKGFFQRLFKSRNSEKNKNPPADLDANDPRIGALLEKLIDKVQSSEKKIQELSGRQPDSRNDIPSESSAKKSENQPLEEILSALSDRIDQKLAGLPANQAAATPRASQPQPAKLDANEIAMQVADQFAAKISEQLKSLLPPDLTSEQSNRENSANADLDDQFENLLEQNIGKALASNARDSLAESKSNRQSGEYDNVSGISSSRNKRVQPMPSKKKKRRGVLELSHRPHDIISPTSPYRHHLRSLQNAELFVKEKEYQMSLDLYERLQAKIPNNEIKDKVQENINDINAFLEEQDEEEDKLSSIVSMVMSRLPKPEDSAQEKMNAEERNNAMVLSLEQALKDLDKKQQAAKKEESSSGGSNPLPSSADGGGLLPAESSNKEKKIDQKTGKRDPGPPEKVESKNQTDLGTDRSKVETQKIVQEIKQGFFDIQKAIFESEKTNLNMIGGQLGNGSTGGESAGSGSGSSTGAGQSAEAAKSDNTEKNKADQNVKSDQSYIASEKTEVESEKTDIYNQLSGSGAGGAAGSGGVTGAGGSETGASGGENAGTSGNSSTDAPSSGSGLSGSSDGAAGIEEEPSLPSIPPLSADGKTGALGGSGASEEEQELEEEKPEEEEQKTPPQEIRGIFELKKAEEEDTPFLTLTYNFENIPHEFALSKDHNIMEYVYYKYKPMLVKAQKFIKRKQITKALNYYRVIRDQYIPDEFKQMVDRNIQDITEYLQKYLVARKS